MILASLLLATGGLTITLPPTSEVRGSEIMLFEVATIEGEASLIERAKNLSLGWAPNPGYTRLLFAELIERRIEKALADVDVHMAGSKTCRVSPMTSQVSGSSIEQAARGWLQSATIGREVDLHLSTAVADLTIPFTATGVQLVPRVDKALVYSGRLQVPIEIRIDGLPWRSVWTQWEVSLFERRPALLRDLARGEVLGRADLRLQRVRITEASAIAGPHINLLVGATALRDLKRGEAIAATHVRFPIAVKKGSSVTVEVRSGRVQASGVGIALEEGSIGDTIQVSTRGGTDSLQATIISTGVVRVTIR